MSYDRVSDIAFYPVKSCQAADVDGETPSKLSVGMTGFEAHGVADRDFIVVDAHEALMVTQRGWRGSKKGNKHPGDSQLAKISVDVGYDHLKLSASQHGTIEVATALPGGEMSEVEIFGDTLHAYDQGDEIAAYFTRLLGREVRLLRRSRQHTRFMSEKYQSNYSSIEVSAVDSSPFLLTSEASLHQSEQDAGYDAGSVDMRCYRYNIAMTGNELGPYREDYIRELTVGNMAAVALKDCARCPIPDYDQSNGERTGGGLKVLGERVGKRSDDGPWQQFFGLLLAHVKRDDEIMQVQIGDPIHITSELQKKKNNS